MKTKNKYFGLFYKNRGKWTGPYGRQIFRANELNQTNINSISRAARKQFAVKQLTWN